MCPFLAVANLESVKLSKFKEMLERGFCVLAAAINQTVVFEVVKVFGSPIEPFMGVYA